jgi:hypothetical protein
MGVIIRFHVLGNSTLVVVSVGKTDQCTCRVEAVVIEGAEVLGAICEIHTP